MNGSVNVPGVSYPEFSKKSKEIAEQIDELSTGKAPAGYGLGGDAKWITGSNALSTYTLSGFYAWGADYASGVSDTPFPAGSMIVVNRNEHSSHQIAFRDDMVDGSIAVRKRVESVWGEWEYVNPPMIPGIEYRTTERWGGNVVYTRLLECGEIGTGAATIPLNNDGLIGRVIRYTASGSRGVLPFWFESDDSTYNISATYDNGTLYVYSNGGYAGMLLYVQIWYIKEV